MTKKQNVKKETNKQNLVHLQDNKFNLKIAFVYWKPSAKTEGRMSVLDCFSQFCHFEIQNNPVFSAFNYTAISLTFYFHCPIQQRWH